MTLTTLKRIFFSSFLFVPTNSLDIPTYDFFFLVFCCSDTLTVCYIVSIAITKFNDAASFTNEDTAKQSKAKRTKRSLKKNIKQHKDRPQQFVSDRNRSALLAVHIFYAVLFLVSAIHSAIFKEYVPITPTPNRNN